MAGTKIEWTDMVWNPTSGCSKVSEGCRNCYAERFARRLAGRCGYPADNPFQVTLHPERLEEPLRWKKHRRVFVNSMGDLFHKDVDEKFIAKAFAIMDLARQHTYCILTKRPERVALLLADEDFQFHVGWFQSQAVRELGLPEPEQIGPWPLRNVWVGTSVENQQVADERIPSLLEIPAVVRFVSCEPLLGPLDLGKWIGPRMCYCGWRGYEWEEEDDPESDDETLCPNCGASSLYELGDVDTCCGYSDDYERHPIHWIIAGGESGHGARPCHPDWVRSLREQAVSAGIPFFFKQWGEWLHVTQGATPLPVEQVDGIRAFDFLDGQAVRIGKKQAGRVLDGKIWEQFPEVQRG